MRGGCLEQISVLLVSDLSLRLLWGTASEQRPMLVRGTGFSIVVVTILKSAVFPVLLSLLCDHTCGESVLFVLFLSLCT